MSGFENGSIWREKDNRFERVVEVVNGWVNGGQRVEVRTIWWEGKVAANLERTTYVSGARFPKAFRPCEDPRS